MMTKDRIRIIFVAALLSLPAAEASDFEGAYVGGKIGYNTNSPSSGSTSNDLYPGIEAGYGWAVGQALVGLDAFADGHYKSITSNDYGADVKLGLPTDRFLPYLKLGLAASEPGTRFHGGLGIEYKFAPQWAVSGEWTTDSKTVDSIDQKNNNISVGLTYYFNAPVVAPVAMAPPAPVVAKEPEPVIAPAPVIAQPTPVPPPAPAPATIFADKPVTIEGTNFATNSAKLKPTASEQLNKVVEFAAKYKEASLTVVGYTDSTGKEKANRVLSEKRAESVKAYLVGKGIEANRIATSGKGSANPVGDNKTAAGRAKNRRVEIRSTIRIAQ